MSAPQYYLFLNNKQAGPYSFGQIQNLWNSNAVNAQTLYWTEGFTDWEPLSGMADMFEKAAPKSFSRQTNATIPAPINSKLKERAKWWIVSTHVLTAVFAMPVIATIFATTLIGLLGSEGILAILIMVLFNFAGYIGGTYYSLSYLKKNAKTSDWKGCTIPSLIVAVLLNFGTVIFFHPYPIINSIVSLINLVAFGIITSNEFSKLDENN